jgi:pimeloyl-ACP methyl ester carboxylesterase
MITHRNVEANGINVHLAEAGEGPLVVLLHGFPELWYSYRHQLPALAEAGYHAVAPDMRGYGRTDSPADISQYTMPRLAGDVIGLVNELGGERFVVVGHDWGSPVAANVALFRPDLVRGVVLLSVPYLPRGDLDVLTMLTETLGPDNYQVYFQEPGLAETALEADVRASVLSTLIGCSGDVPEINLLDKVDPTQPLARDALGFGDQNSRPLPAWLTEEDIDYYTGEFERTGYGGGLNWYRTSKLNWELLAAWQNAPLMAPSLFVAGERDLVVNWPVVRDVIPMLREMSMPNLTQTVLIEGSGHWVQQERPNEVNDLLIEFLTGLDD